MKHHLRSAQAQAPEQRLDRLDQARQEGELSELALEEARAIEALFKGELLASIALLQEIEARVPGRYSTAANLGTAYELNGDLKEALRWINEGIVRNPNAHDGTEWLHRRILEVKIVLESEPDYLLKHRLLPLPKVMDHGTNVAIGDQVFSLKEIRKALLYQLGERLIFVKPKSSVVAELLFALGRIEAHLSVLESSLPVLEMAEEYGFADHRHLFATRSHYQDLIGRQKLRHRLKIGCFCALGIALIIWIYFRGQRGWELWQKSLAKRET